MPPGIYERKSGIVHGPAAGHQQIKTGTRPKRVRIKQGSAYPALKDCSDRIYAVVVQYRGSKNNDELVDIMERDA